MARYQIEGQIPQEIDLETFVIALYTLGVGIVTRVTNKDPQIARQVWLVSVRRIIKLDNVTKKYA